MALSLGIVGLPNSGKSTLFNALTKAGAAVASYPFTTIEPNVGVVPVPDHRLAEMVAIVHTSHLIPATIEFVDIAGLVQGASKGEGLGNQFLGHIRNVDAVVIVLRCFANPDVPHFYGEIDPRRDALILSTELGLADLASLARRLERARIAAKGGDKHALREAALLGRLHDHLNAGQPARSFAVPPEDADFARDVGLTSGLLTAKPVLYVANVGEDDLAATIAQLDAGRPELPWLAALWRLAQAEGAELVAIAARLEAELHELTPAEARDYLASLGVTQSGLERLIRAGYRLLSLITFFTTTGGKEVRAWPVVQGTKAPQAAGKVHTDMERGFIRAEVIGYSDLSAVGAFAEARERGLLRLEGHDYVVQDGDIIHFRFAV